MRRHLRALGANVVLLLLLAGLPLLLAATIGNPAPSWSALAAGDLSDTVVTAVLATIAWACFAAAWASFAWTVTLEILALARRTPQPHIRAALPGFQPAAHTLVVAAFMLLPTTTHAASTLSRTASTAYTTALTAPTVPLTITVHAQTTRAGSARDHTVWAGALAPTEPGAGAPASAVEYLIHPGGPQTLWDLAQTSLGDGTRWRQIWDLNAGRHQSDGSVLTSPGLLRPGWSILLPADARVPGDDHIWAENPRSTTVSPILSPPVQASAGEMLSTVVPVFGAGTGAGLLIGVSLRELASRRRRQFRYRRPGRTIPPTPPALAPMHKTLIRHGDGAVDEVDWLDESLRTLAQQIDEAGGDLPDVIAARLSSDMLELVLANGTDRAAARPPHPWQVDEHTGRWQLQRQLHDRRPADQRHAYRWQFAPYPALVSIGHTPDGDRWLLDLEHAGTLTLTGNPSHTGDLARFMAAELANSTWSEQLDVTLIGMGDDVTAINSYRLTRPDDPHRALARASAQLAGNHAALDNCALPDTLHGRARDLAADLWMPHLLFVNLPGAPPEVARAALSLAEALLSPRRRTGLALVLLGQENCEDPGPATGNGTGHPQEARQEEVGGIRVRIGADRTAHLPHLDQTLTVQHLPATAARQLGELITARADLHDQEMPAARGPAPWQAYTDAAGAPSPRFTTPDPETRDATGPPTGDPDDAGLPDDQGSPRATGRDIASMLGTRRGQVLGRAATTEADLRRLAPAISGPVRNLVEDSDPGLDDDLVAWHDPDCGRARLSLLGPIVVRASGSLPESRPRRAWHTEVLCYLAAHPRGVTAEQLAADLWPEDPGITADTQTVRQSVYSVRRWLGIDPTSTNPYVSSATAGTPAGARLWRVENVQTDADLFARLRVRGISAGPDGFRDLHTALALVTGPPLDHRQRRRAGYTWLIDTPLDVEYTAMIIDVAHLVATHHLATGRPDLAAHAAQTSLTAGSRDDIPLLDLVAACDAQGHHAQAAAWIQRILSNHDVGLEEDLPPRTADILHRRQWLKPQDQPDRTRAETQAAKTRRPADHARTP
jgi:hypothetical protein